MPFYVRANMLDNIQAGLEEAKSGLGTRFGYEDAEDEINMAIEHVSIAAKILRAEDEEDFYVHPASS